MLFGVAFCCFINVIIMIIMIKAPHSEKHACNQRQTRTHKSVAPNNMTLICPGTQRRLTTPLAPADHPLSTG